MIVLITALVKFEFLLSLFVFFWYITVELGVFKSIIYWVIDDSFGLLDIYCHKPFCLNLKNWIIPFIFQ